MDFIVQRQSSDKKKVEIYQHADSTNHHLKQFALVLVNVRSPGGNVGAIEFIEESGV
ncbi:hypothetical protein [Endozoicomonas lisbonensis]|uniref:Uncharacterized protein n=1 Tax=Endozoicomonas lisbonensis TaxID=3120522 RepID=A0ABV2SJF4_9GAMM